MSKDKAMIDFFKQFSDLTFNALSEENGLMSLISDDEEVPTNYTCSGIKKKEYHFAIVKYANHDNNGRSNINLEEMNHARQIIQWLKQQNKVKNFPLFENANVYEIECLQEMPSIAGTYEDNTAKYMVQGVVRYIEGSI